ncbi:MAG: HAMP domain-containing protein, partial [Polyangiaceae bacterium]
MALRFPGRTASRLAIAILMVAVIPLGVAILLADSLFNQASAIWFKPEVGQQLDRGVDVYKDYVKAIKDDMRHQTDAIAADEVLREAARKKNIEVIEAQLNGVFSRFPELVTLRIEDADGNPLARRDRGRPVNEKTERSLEVRRPLTDGDGAPVVIAIFAIDRKRLDELESAGAVVTTYHQLEASRGALYQGFLYEFAALLGITMLVTVSLGTFLARGVTRRINRLAAAINLVAVGDLSARVPVGAGADEFARFAVEFNRMADSLASTVTRLEA